MNGLDPKLVRISSDGCPHVPERNGVRNELTADELEVIRKSGSGDNTQDCSGTSNSGNCMNDARCDGSSNGGRCFNLGSCSNEGSIPTL